MDWTAVLATLASINSYTLQIVGLQICFSIVKKGTSGETSPAPFVVCFVSSCVWLKYGLMTEVTSIILLNILCCVLQTLYLIVFYLYIPKKIVLYQQVLIGLVILFPPLLYLRFLELSATKAVRHLGFYCCCLSIIGYASPLATLKQVIQQKSTDSMSFPIVLCNFSAAILWTLYGLALKDNFVVLPNSLGVLLCLAQFSLFILYRSERREGLINSGSLSQLHE